MRVSLMRYKSWTDTARQPQSTRQATRLSAGSGRAQRPAPRQDLEHAEQVTLVEWAQLHTAVRPELDLLFAIPNGGHRHRRTAARLKAEGTRAGVPDMFLPVASHGYHGLFIEMKAPDGRERPAQKWWRQRLTAQGYQSIVCVGAGQAIAVLGQYLSIPVAA